MDLPSRDSVARGGHEGVESDNRVEELLLPSFAADELPVHNRGGVEELLGKSEKGRGGLARLGTLRISFGLGGCTKLVPNFTK